MLYPGDVCFYLEGTQIKSATLKNLSLGVVTITDEDGVDREVSAADFKTHFHEKELTLWEAKREQLIENNRVQKTAFKAEMELCEKHIESLRKPRKPRVVKEGAAKPGRKPKVAAEAVSA